MDALERYIRENSTPQGDALDWLERQSWLRTSHGRQISGPVLGSLLRHIVLMLRPQRILEIGTFSGYSAAATSLSNADSIPLRLCTCLPRRFPDGAFAACRFCVELVHCECPVHGYPEILQRRTVKVHPFCLHFATFLSPFPSNGRKTDSAFPVQGVRAKIPARIPSKVLSKVGGSGARGKSGGLQGRAKRNAGSKTRVKPRKT